MGKVAIIDIPVKDWDNEGFYVPGLNLFVFREDTPTERRQELIQQIL